MLTAIIAVVGSLIAALSAALFHTGKKLAATENTLKVQTNALQTKDIDTKIDQQKLAIDIMDEKRRKNEEAYRNSFNPPKR